MHGKMKIKSLHYFSVMCVLITALFTVNSANAQLKSLIEDFEGFADGQKSFEKEGLFSYGSIELKTIREKTKGFGYSGRRAMQVKWSGDEYFGGWGKGLGLFKHLNHETDHFNFYILNPVKNDKNTLRIIIQDDDNHSGKFEEEHDDSWEYTLELKASDEWQLISVPLKDFENANEGGDGIFNINYRGGMLLGVVFDFPDIEQYSPHQKWYFDFLSFSNGKLPTGETIFHPPPADEDDFSTLGAWTEKGLEGKISNIAEDFENLFNCSEKEKKQLGVIHFFKPFAVDGGHVENLYPDVKSINTIVQAGYTPMITLETRFIGLEDESVQPNLYSIVEGHFDNFLSNWARQVSQIEGVVLLRILHEFNGDWYPWSIAQNDRNPDLYIRAYRHIRNIFRNLGVDNVQFVWCPNSMSTPQEHWNYIMDAYPGDEYVDFVGLDVFNGAGQTGVPVWRSFRKETADIYYMLTQELPHKPLLLCETASRERMNEEEGQYFQSKAQWIEQMSEALTTDFSKFRLVVWFNQYEPFKVESSFESRMAFLKYIWENPHFQSGNRYFENSND